jgi:hypothetical protein
MMEMNGNRYSLAGWLAIAQAVVFPAAIVASIAQGALGAAINSRFVASALGPSDILFVTFTGMVIYTLYMLRHLLNERYGFHEIDTLITIAIWWNVIFQVTMLALQGVQMVAWQIPEVASGIVFLLFLSSSMLIGGIVDIVIGIKLLKAKDRLSDLLTVFACITLVSGFSQATVILTPLSMILLPVWCVTLAMIFLRSKEEVQFV